jgi:hypothetical protein
MPAAPQNAPYPQEPFSAASVTDGSLPAASFPAPTTQAASKSRLPLIIGLVIVGAGSLAGGAWAVTHGSRGATAAPAAVVTTPPQPPAPLQPNPPAQVAPPAAPTLPAAVAATGTNAVESPGARGTANNHLQPHRNTTGRNTTANAGGGLDIIPLTPSTLSASNSGSSNSTASAPSNPNTAAATHDDPPRPPPVHNDPPPVRNDPPRQTASNTSSTASRSNGGTTTTSTPAANTAPATQPPRPGHIELGRDWN